MAAKKKAAKAGKKRAARKAGPTAPSGGAFDMIGARKPDPDGPWRPGEGWAQSGGTGQGTWLKARGNPKPPKPK